MNALMAAGHVVHIACYTREGRKNVEVKGNVSIHRKHISSFTYKSSVGALKFPFYFNFWRKFLKTILNKEGFDAIHVHDLPLARVGYELARKYDIKFILDLHENWPALVETSTYANTFIGKLLSSNKQWKQYEKEYTTKADYVVTVVEEMKERICKTGVSCDKIIVLNNTFNLAHAFELKGPAKNKNTILYYAGGLTYHRGLQIVIKGLKYIISQRKNVEVWIVGSGKYMPVLKQIVRDEKLSEHVRFYGQKAFEETMELLSRSDIALIPHLKSVQTDNSSPNKLFQYMYFGKAVLVSNCNSVERIVHETSCGAVYEYDNPESFAGAAIEMIESDSAESYGKNGRDAVLSKYNWQNSVKPFLNMYNSLK